MNTQAQTVKKILPRQGAIYSLRQVLLSLSLDDSPFLNFMHKGKRCVIQDGHVSDEEMLNIRGFADSRWKYMYTTEEWCPVFEFMDADIEKFVSIEREYDYDGSLTDGFYVTPKGFYCKQFSAPKGVRSENKNMFVYNSYWRTWSRILQEGTPHNNFEFIEVNVTPVNPDFQHSWPEQITPVRIRKHGTTRSRDDKFVGTLPEEVVAMLNEHVPQEIQHFLLHEDLLPQIDWDLYRKHNNGGADFDLIRKPKR